MARIIVGSYLVRFPMGGYLSWALQWMIGFQRLGHEVYFVEKAGWPNACYDPARDEMTDDCSYGTAALVAHLAPLGLQDSWCFVDARDRYHGMSRRRLTEVFASADLFIDMGTHGAWLPDVASNSVTVLVDGDPGYTQMLALTREEELGEYDFYYTVGRNVGRPGCTVPTMGLTWRHVFDPVVTDLFDVEPAPADAPFNTVMAWQSYPAIEFEGRTYGAKSQQFARFLDLPSRTSVPLALAVGGKGVPEAVLAGAGWQLDNPVAATQGVPEFHRYIRRSRGEFSVNKSFYVETASGFFSDRSAAYLASGRPVVMQDTGFSAHLPCGIGLLAVQDVQEAAEALGAVVGDYARHAARAREIARECLDASVVLPAFLQEVGVA